MIPSLQIKQNNLLTDLRRKIQAIEMGKVVVKATELICRVDLIFKATDGNTYYIDAPRSEVIEAIYGDYPRHDNMIEISDLLEWINKNPGRWERDSEC